MKGREELTTETILWLQTTCGNRAVQRLLLRRGFTRTNQPEGTVEPRPTLWHLLRRWFGYPGNASSHKLYAADAKNMAIRRKSH